MKILLVQDSAKQGRFLQRALREVGHMVEMVFDGAEAIHSSASVNYDLVILDWVLPGMDGLRVCRSLRQHGSRFPILMLSNQTAVADRILGLDSGADNFLPKPFDVNELLAHVRALGRRISGTGGHVRVGPLVLNRFERQASLNGQAVELTPREFSLLTYLAREAGRVVPRTELLSKVWDMGYDPNSNIIDAHVKKLREKLGSCARLIETVRGVGYRMESMPASSP